MCVTYDANFCLLLNLKGVDSCSWRRARRGRSWQCTFCGHVVCTCVMKRIYVQCIVFHCSLRMFRWSINALDSLNHLAIGVDIEYTRWYLWSTLCSLQCMKVVTFLSFVNATVSFLYILGNLPCQTLGWSQAAWSGNSLAGIDNGLFTTDPFKLYPIKASLGINR